MSRKKAGEDDYVFLDIQDAQRNCWCWRVRKSEVERDTAEIRKRWDKTIGPMSVRVRGDTAWVTKQMGGL